MIGCYILLIELKTPTKIQIGKLGKVFFKKGFYLYIGSAMNSLEGRIKRHLRSEKKLHWHIDYLLQNADVIDVFYKETNEKIECKTVNFFNQTLANVTGFGCSDCKCRSHLFYSTKKQIKQIINNASFKKYISY
jgi:Uri superfamily endonuclease